MVQFESGRVRRACIAENRVQITPDLGLSDVRAYPPGSHPGIWVLRPPKQTFGTIEALVQTGVRLSAVERVQGQLWVIDEKRVRIHDGDANPCGAKRQGSIQLSAAAAVASIA